MRTVYTPAFSRNAVRVRAEAFQLSLTSWTWSAGSSANCRRNGAKSGHCLSGGRNGTIRSLNGPSGSSRVNWSSAPEREGIGQIWHGFLGVGYGGGVGSLPGS